MSPCTVLLGTHSLALSHVHQVLTVSDMQSFISEQGKPKYGAAKTRTQKMNCDMLVHRKNQLVRQLTQLERPHAPTPNRGADGAAAQSIAWVAILDARGMELRDTWCEVKVFSLVGQAGQKQVTKICKSHPHPCWNEAFTVPLSRRKDEKDLKALAQNKRALQSLRNIMRNQSETNTKLMVTCDVVSKSMLRVGDKVLATATFFVQEDGAAIDCWAPLELPSGQSSETMSLHVRLWAGKRSNLEAVLAPLQRADARQVQTQSSQLLDRVWQKIEEFSDGAIVRDDSPGSHDETKVPTEDEREPSDASNRPPNGPCELSVTVRECSNLRLSRSVREDSAGLYVAVVPCSKVFMRTTLERLAVHEAAAAPTSTQFDLVVLEDGELGLSFRELRRGARRSMLSVMSVHDRGLAARDPRMVPGLLLSQLNGDSMRGKSATAVAKVIAATPRPVTLTFVRERAGGRFKSSFEQVLTPSMSAEGLGNHNHVDTVVQISVFVRNEDTAEFLNLDDDPALRVGCSVFGWFIGSLVD